MNYSDEQYKNGEQRGDGVSDKVSVGIDADNDVMPKIVPTRTATPKPAPQPDEPSGNSFVDELLSAIFKTTFVALSLIAMLACIIAFAIPLTTMRLFNSMGLSERAVDFGERYISRELESNKSTDGKRTAAYADSDGNMPVLTATPALTNDDFIEALYVCNNLSDKLMTESLKAGDNARAEYYAVRLEKYTRTYLSLNGLSAVTLKKDRDNIASVPAAVRPAVYSYEHDMHVLNYRARAVLGKTDKITYNNRSERLGVMTTPSERSERLYGTVADTEQGRIALLDEYVDYAAQLGAYLDIEFMRIGVETDFSKRYTIKVKEPVSGDEISLNVTALNDRFVQLYYSDKLDGDEFSLFILPLKEVTPDSYGFTRLFNQLSSFTRYAQMAVDTVPSEENGVLHQLYWLRVLSDVSRKLWYMEMLLYGNMKNLGMNGEAIRDAVDTCKKYTLVDYKLTGMSSVTSCQILEVYADKLAAYIGGNN
ncbi:MAG: hypothetical protein K2M47_06850 [Clostridiales bacterium]|nr:hypothetical protein [Clostridiales bacterium]